MLKHTKITLIKNEVLLEKPLYSICICKKPFSLDTKHKAQCLKTKKKQIYILKNTLERNLRPEFSALKLKPNSKVAVLT